MSEPMEWTGVVAEILPNERYRCTGTDGREAICHISGEMRLKVVRVLKGDEVRIEPSPFDPSKGRIVGWRELSRRQES